MVKYPPCFPLPSVLGELGCELPCFLKFRKQRSYQIEYALSICNNAWSLCERYIIELKISVPEIPTGITKLRVALATNSLHQIACHGFPKGRQIFPQLFQANIQTCWTRLGPAQDVMTIVPHTDPAARAGINTYYSRDLLNFLSKEEKSAST